MRVFPLVCVIGVALLATTSCGDDKTSAEVGEPRDCIEWLDRECTLKWWIFICNTGECGAEWNCTKGVVLSDLCSYQHCELTSAANPEAVHDSYRCPYTRCTTECDPF